MWQKPQKRVSDYCVETPKMASLGERRGEGNKNKTFSRGTGENRGVRVGGLEGSLSRRYGGHQFCYFLIWLLDYESFLGKIPAIITNFLLCAGDYVYLKLNQRPVKRPKISSKNWIC